MKIVPLSHEAASVEIARRILATSASDARIAQPILAKAGVATVEDLRALKLRDILRQRGVGPGKMLRAMTEAAGQLDVRVDDMAHPLSVIPLLPGDALMQALHAGLVIHVDRRASRIMEPVIEDGVVVAVEDSERTAAYNGDREGVRRTGGERITAGEWAGRTYRDAVSAEGMRVITLTEKGRRESSAAFGPIDWAMPTPKPAQDNGIAFHWGADREAALALVAGPALAGGRERDSLTHYTMPPVMADEQQAMLRHPLFRELQTHGGRLIGTTVETVTRKAAERPALVEGRKRGAPVWMFPGERWSVLARAQRDELVETGWLAAGSDGGLRPTPRYVRAWLAHCTQLHSYGRPERLCGYVVEGASPLPDGQFVAMWFDTAGCTRMETLNPVGTREYEALRNDIATEAGTTVEELRYDIGISYAGMVVPMREWLSGDRPEVAACPRNWLSAGGARLDEVRRANEMRGALAGLLEALGAGERPEDVPPVPGDIPTDGTPSPRPIIDRKRLDAIEAQADGVVDGAPAEPRDPARRTRLLLDEIVDIVNSRRKTAVRVDGKDVVAYDVDDVDHEAGIVVLKVAVQTTYGYSRPQDERRVRRMMVDVRSVTAVMTID